MLTTDGGYVWLMSRGHGSVRNEQGIATRLIGTIVEITDRKNSELALRRSEALATAIFNASTDAVCLLNEGVILDCNASALPLLASIHAAKSSVSRYLSSRLSISPTVDHA